MKVVKALGAVLMLIALLQPSTGFAYTQADDKKETKTEETKPEETKTEETNKDEPKTDDEKTDGEKTDEPKDGDDSKTPVTYEVPDLVELTYGLDNILLFFCAVLVLFMQAGFAMVESGFNSAKNVVNIMSKNLMDICVGVLVFYLVGYGLMYPGSDYEGGYFGFGGFGRPEAAVTYDEAKAGMSTADGTLRTLDPQVDFLFQVAFAATAATIVSGAVAGRMRFEAYMIYSIVLTGFVYPISGMWKWGGGWLNAAGFQDFAGSLVVHAVGGFAGLAGAIVLGPRLGKYGPDGKPQAIPAHNLALATLGVFILWIGWYGFNPGSQLAYAGLGNTHAVVLIALNTTLAAAAGGVLGLVTAWCIFGKPDLTMGLNGVLAGLVGITANCDCVSNFYAIVIGAVAGALVVLGCLMLDKLKIDDPVGAFPVHGLCGLWGGIATGIFGKERDLVVQIWASLVICVWAFVTMFILFTILKSVGILRVSPEEEEQGLDVSEHGMHAYIH